MLNFNRNCIPTLVQGSKNVSTVPNYFQPNHFWLLLTQNSNIIVDLNEESNVFIPPDSEVRILIDNPSSTMVSGTTRSMSQGYSLIDIYKITAANELKVHVISENFHQICKMLYDLAAFGSAISYRQNLEGTIFRTGQAVPFPDQFITMEDLTLRHANTITKAHYRILQNLKQQLNMRCIFNIISLEEVDWLTALFNMIVISIFTTKYLVLIPTKWTISVGISPMEALMD